MEWSVETAMDSGAAKAVSGGDVTELRMANVTVPRWRTYPYGKRVDVVFTAVERPEWWRRWLQAVFLGWRWERIE